MYGVSSTLSHLIIWEPWPAVDHTAKKILMLGLVILWRKIKKIVPTNYVYFPLDTSEKLIYMTTKKTLRMQMYAQDLWQFRLLSAISQVRKALDAFFTHEQRFQTYSHSNRV